jgi:hypothetical protein
MVHMKTSIVIVIILAAAVAATAYFQIYIAEGGGATVFWRGEEAYLFPNTPHTGYHFSYLKYPWVVISEYFRVRTPPNDTRDSSLVISVTPSAVKRYVSDDRMITV